MKSILDPLFKYTPAVSTDLRKTFARIKRRQRVEQVAADQQRLHDEEASVQKLAVVRALPGR